VNATAVTTVFWYALLTALATGLGALPFALVRVVSPRIVALANAVAAGLMLGASFALVVEGSRYGGAPTEIGVLLGVGFVLAAERLLRDREVRFAGAAGAGAKRMLLMVAVMTVHSAAEGVAVGVAFSGTGALAAAITVAIAVHNVPEGVAITAVLRPRGVSLDRCAGWSIFSSLPQPLLAVPAFLFVQAFAAALPYGLGFAAGAMMFMVFEELLPEAYGDAPRASVAALASLFLVAMVAFQRYL
jgi:zinc transporter ZupT